MMDSEPPDPGGGSFNFPQSMEIEDMNNAKRNIIDDNDNLSKAKRPAIVHQSPSVQLNYVTPEFQNGKRLYSSEDTAPFIVHVTKSETSANSGTILRPIQFGQFLYKNNINNIVIDGIKRIGRNRVSIEFKTSLQANSFLDLPILSSSGYIASIPSYSVSRMGIVREVPVDWTMEELVSNIEVPSGYGGVVKARRLSRKSMNDQNVPVWIPTQSVVLTFTGQKLPSHVYCYFTSLPVETYVLPTIQCNKCCRFGHVKAQCRSRPRCYKCAQMHEGETCSVDTPTCLFCSGSHNANNTSCPEHSRQKAIKLVMSQESISYLEASARFPQVRRPFADTVRTSPNNNILLTSPDSNQPKTISYKKTTFSPRRPIPTAIPGYNHEMHRDIVREPDSQTLNGCALSQNTLSPNDNLVEQLANILVNLISRFSDTGIPNRTRTILTQLCSILFNNGNQVDSVE